SAARTAGIPKDQRDAHTRAIQEATASHDWDRAGQYLAGFRAEVEGGTTIQRYDAFRAHVQGGFDRLANLAGSKEQWQSKVDAVQEAWRSADLDLLDSRLNEYSAYVESHVPSAMLTGQDAPRPFHQDVEDVRQRLATTTDGPAADRLRSQLEELRRYADLRDRLDRLRSSEPDPETAALHRRLDDAETPEEAERALRDLEAHRRLQELQQRLDRLGSDEPTPQRTPPRGSEADLRRRLEALNDGADDRERELLDRADRAADANEAHRALRELYAYRDYRRLQQRLDRLTSDTSEDRPSERDLRDRLEALHDGENDPLAAQLRRQAYDAATEQGAREALDKLDQHLSRREQSRQDKVRALTASLEQLRQQHIEQLFGAHSGEAEDTARRIEDVRRELSSHQTYDERTSALRQELARKTGTPEARGHLDRITTGTDRRGGTDEPPPDREHTPVGEHPASAHGEESSDDGAVVSADRLPTRDQHTPGHGTGEQKAKPVTGPRRPQEEQPRHPIRGDQQLVAQRPLKKGTTPGLSHDDQTDPSRHSVPSIEGLDDLRGSADALRPGPPPREWLDRTRRYVVKSEFDQRRFTVDDTPYTDLTVRVALRDDGSGRYDTADIWNKARQGVKQYFNDPGYKLLNGDRLHVTLERVGPGDKPHLIVDLVDDSHGIDQSHWPPSAGPIEYAHEIAHQLGLRDEHADETAPHRPHIPGSLLGDFHQQPEHQQLAHGGLRGRHFRLLDAVIAGYTVPEESQDHLGESQDRGQRRRHDDPADDPAWQQSRTQAPAMLRQHSWVDPMSEAPAVLERSATGGPNSVSGQKVTEDPGPDGVRKELSSHQTSDERADALRQGLAQKTGITEDRGHLDRITAGTDRRGGTDEHTPVGERPASAHAGPQGAGTPTRRPDAAAHNPTTATATQGTGPANAGRTTPPATVPQSRPSAVTSDGPGRSPA
ncbi:hypothetical protein, partial [Streptomyces sp. MUM 2J]|uniref:hypothetical protein n=1 Tax=Streptomyces sp. MUM 2J TaxID=2791987 RepID=UPI001F040D20